MKRFLKKKPLAMKKMDADVMKLVEASIARIPHHEQVFFFPCPLRACIL